MARVREYDFCRVCAADLQTVLNLGALAVSAFPRPQDDDGPQVPLDLCKCVGCGLVQLRHAVDPEDLYRDYWYQSGVNETMVAELRDVVDEAITYVGGLTDRDTVIDIGANDGTLLRMYPRDEVTPLVRIAFEPARDFLVGLTEIADIIVPQVFPPPAGWYRPRDRRARIVTSIACFYDVNDPVGFAQAVERVLAPNGVWIIQLQDLHQMIEATAFDNICHEHVTYLSLAAIAQIVARAGLVVSRVQRRAINGGSLRIFITRPHLYPIDPSVAAWRATEAGCDSWARLERFGAQVSETIERIRAIVASAQRAGKVLDLYAASTKANTLLQACGFTGANFRQAWERTPSKWGRQTVVSRIPIVSEEAGRMEPPDLLFLGAWQFADAFVQREAGFLAAGGQMIVPLPEVEIVSGVGVV